IAVFVFHEFQKRAQAKTEVRTAAAEAAQARARSEELEQLMAFGQTLANALDQPSLQQALWRYLPTFAHHRPFWVMTYRGSRWEPLIHDGNRAIDALEQLALRAVSPDASRNPADDEAEELRLPLMAGGAPV